MIRDRSRIEWVSMMLPEHVKLLREYNKSLAKVEMPILDEQKYEEFNEVICGAMEENITLQFTYYQKGEIKKLVGKIHYIDGLKKEVRIINLTSEKRILELGDIIEIEYY
jgi:uncharacterized protein YdaL